MARTQAGKKTTMRANGTPPIDDFVSKKAAANAPDLKAMENWLWEAACSIRGAMDAPKFKDYILPLVFLKRLSDVFDDEVSALSDQFGDAETAMKFVDKDHSLVRFFVPAEARWSSIRKLSSKIGEKLTDAIRAITKANPSLQGVIDIVDYNQTTSGQRIIDDNQLSSLIERLSDPRFRLGLRDVEPDFLGRAYEYLLRKFAEGQGQSAGEFFTPKEVGWLIAYLVNAKQGESVYDPACGSGGLLIKCQLALKEKGEKITKPLQLFGQERNHVTYAIAKMNMIIHDMEGQIAIGDSLRNPKFSDNSSLKKFDIVVANPMWNQKGYGDIYDNDAYGRFDLAGPAPANNADWGWIQHMATALDNSGRAAIVIDSGAVARGSGEKDKDREREIRKKFVENDWIEGVILLPDNLFYNTPSPGIILLLNKNKKPERRNKILLINASNTYEKGRPKNFIPMDKGLMLSEIFHSFTEVKNLSTVITIDDAIKKDYNLSPSLFVGPDGDHEYHDIIALVNQIKEIQLKNELLDQKLEEIVSKLGYKTETST